MIRRFGCLAAAAIAACAATGVTLRSHHYRVYVPPGWQVIEPGGDAVLPTHLRIPGEPTVDLRLFAWVIEGPIADPTAEAFKRLVASSVIGPAADATPGAPPPCSDRSAGFVVFGQPARAMNFEAAGAQRLVVTGAYTNGSLVGIVASTQGDRPLCGDIDSMRAAIGRLTDLLTPSSDPSRPAPRPILLDEPHGSRTIELPPADPNSPQ